VLQPPLTLATTVQNLTCSLLSIQQILGPQCASLPWTVTLCDRKCAPWCSTNDSSSLTPWAMASYGGAQDACRSQCSVFTTIDFKQTYKHLHIVTELNASCLAILWLVRAKFVTLSSNLKQDRQHICDLTVRRVRVTTVVVEKQWVLHLLSACLYTYVYSMQSACTTIYCHLWPAPLYNIFPHYLINGTFFGKKFI